VKMKINEGRALRVFKTLDDLWGEGAPIFKDVVLSQNRWPMPEKGIANYLFYASLPMRGAVNSDDPFKLLFELYKKHPDLFDPNLVARCWTPEKIVKAIKSVSREKLLERSCSDAEFQENGGSLGYRLTERAEYWYQNSVILSTYWGGDILNVFNYGIVDFEDVFRRIDNNITEAGFVGMRRKIFSLLTIWLQEKGFIPTFPTPLPVDFHALRVLWATKCIDLPKNAKSPIALQEYYPSLAKWPAIRMTEQLTDGIAIWSQGFMAENKLSHYNINPAIWVISRDFCNNQLQNKSAAGDSEKFVSSKFFDKEEFRRNPDLWPKNYKNPCMHCPLEKLCTGAAPSNPYYRKGIMVRLERIPYPIQVLPGMEDSFIYNGRRRSVPKK